MKTVISLLFIFLFSTSLASEIIFNSKGERIELKTDGTYVNHGIPTESDGFVFSIVGAKPSKMKWGDNEVDACKFNVQLVNNTKFNLKRAMTDFKSVDDLGKKFGTMQSALFSTVRKGEKVVKSGLNLRGKCSDFKSGFWKVLGGQNPFSFKVHEKGISKDDLLDLVIYSNSGVIKFVDAID